MKPLLIERINAVAPQILIEVIWDPDEMESWEQAGDWTDGERKRDWKCWQSEVKASAICAGDLVSGSDYLGGTWEKASQHPSKSNPDISGYLPQMIEEALESLRVSVPKEGNTASQIERALALVKADMRESYEKQMACRDIATT